MWTLSGRSSYGPLSPIGRGQYCEKLLRKSEFELATPTSESKPIEPKPRAVELATSATSTVIVATAGTLIELAVPAHIPTVARTRAADPMASKHRFESIQESTSTAGIQIRSSTSTPTTKCAAP